MNDECKKRWYSISFIICVSLLITSLPFQLFIKNDWVLFTINVLTRISSIIFILYSLKKEQIKFNIFHKPKRKDLAFIPLLFLCASNFMVAIYQKSVINQVVNYDNIIQAFFISILTAIKEELLFRGILLTEFDKTQSKFKTIIYSALIFGSIHLLNIGSLSSIIPSLLQVLYTAFLGLFLGFIYLYSKNLIYPIIFHFTFNFFNDSLVTNLYQLKWELSYFIINALVGLCVFVYGFILLSIFKRKEISYATKNMDI